MKALSYLIIFNVFVSIQTSVAQDFGGEKIEIANFIRRIYDSSPFNGIKILQTQNGDDYMISVVELKKDPSKSESIMSRIASVKAKSYASQYINGSNISTDVIIVTTDEKAKGNVLTKTTMNEILKESSMGFVDGMELLTNFNTKDATYVVYIYYKFIKNEKK